MNEEGKARAAAFVREEMARRGWTAERLADEAAVDVGTVRSLLKGERWPWTVKRNAIEDALGVPQGSIDLTASGLLEQDSVDPVEKAVRESRLSRANQHKLIGTYYEMLESEPPPGNNERRSG